LTPSSAVCLNLALLEGGPWVCLAEPGSWANHMGGKVIAGLVFFSSDPITQNSVGDGTHSSHHCVDPLLFTVPQKGAWPRPRTDFTSDNLDLDPKEIKKMDERTTRPLELFGPPHSQPNHSGLKCPSSHCDHLQYIQAFRNFPQEVGNYSNTLNIFAEDGLLGS